MRQSHTTIGKKAKCLAYRNSKRCGRVAVALVDCNTATQGKKYDMPMCQECADERVMHWSGIIKIQNDQGFTVSSDVFDTWHQRYYHPIHI